jgi:energy-converting hydrogenase Eha subunit G
LGNVTRLDVYRFGVAAVFGGLAIFGALTWHGWALGFVGFFVVAAAWQIAARRWMDR